ncbi:MAG: RNA methyltransferase [Ruminococcaceae bacterium]|nr:RNA methyltransferase [Oscillospiraceae bacterium]
MITTITSKNNDLLTHIRKLQSNRSYREENRQFVGEGVKLLGEALKAQLQIVVIAGDMDFPPLDDSVRQVRVSPQLMKSISQLTTPQEALFVCAIPEREEPKTVASSLVLDGIQDPGNMGTMIRTADALGIERIILCEGCADPFNPKVVRATMGAIFRQKIYQMTRQELICRAAEENVRLIATALSETAKDVRSVDMKNAAVIIGSEGSGVSKQLLDAAECHVIIPISENCESLNAASAASIIMWEMRKGY